MCTVNYDFGRRVFSKEMLKLVDNNDKYGAVTSNLSLKYIFFETDCKLALNKLFFVSTASSIKT